MLCAYDCANGEQENASAEIKTVKTAAQYCSLEDENGIGVIRPLGFGWGGRNKEIE